MHYWRQDSFDGLESLFSEIKDDPRLSYYANYIDLLNKGLRREALKNIEDFLSLARAWDVKDQRKVVSFLCRVSDSEPIGHRYVPFPIWKRLIKPILADWIAEIPKDPEPLRWTGELDDLRTSLRLDPTCDRTRYRWIQGVLRGVQYATHELPTGYLGNIEEDLTALRDIETEARKIADPEKQAVLIEIINEERALIEDYQAGQDDMNS